MPGGIFSDELTWEILPLIDEPLETESAAVAADQPQSGRRSFSPLGTASEDIAGTDTASHTLTAAEHLPAGTSKQGPLRVDLRRLVVVRRAAAVGAELPISLCLAGGSSRPKCMDRLHFASGACWRKSLICIRPVDRHAGRGLDGSTHAPLISLADRLPSNHLGHQILGASINPFHANPQSRTRLRRRLDRRASIWVSKALSCRRTLQAMRASLLANATASLFLWSRSAAVLSHAPKL